MQPNINRAASLHQPTGLDHIDLLCDQFEAAYQRGEQPRIEEYLGQAGDGQTHRLLNELVKLEIALLQRDRQSTNLSDYQSRFPDYILQMDGSLEITERLVLKDEATPQSVQNTVHFATKSHANSAIAITQAKTLSEGGQTSRPHYEMLEIISQGGMGVVYKARQAALNRLVAVKMVLSGSSASNEELLRFRTEAELAAKLNHPGIVPIFEVGTWDGKPYFSMAYVDGEDLGKKIASKPLSPRVAAKIMVDVCAAVSHAHSQGVIHRDLKPSNILINSEGRPMITDFGLARSTIDANGITHTGTIVGTPSFMSPEQASGKTSEIGTATDIYSLGAVLYSLLTGKPPFNSGNPIETIRQVIEQDAIPIRSWDSNIPRDLEVICSKCMEKSPLKRYATPTELAADLERWLHGMPINARPATMIEKLGKYFHRNPSHALLIITLVGLLVLLSVIITMLTRSPDAMSKVRGLNLGASSSHLNWTLLCAALLIGPSFTCIRLFTGTNRLALMESYLLSFFWLLLNQVFYVAITVVQIFLLFLPYFLMRLFLYGTENEVLAEYTDYLLFSICMIRHSVNYCGAKYLGFSKLATVSKVLLLTTTLAFTFVFSLNNLLNSGSLLNGISVLAILIVGGCTFFLGFPIGLYIDAPFQLRFVDQSVRRLKESTLRISRQAEFIWPLSSIRSEYYYPDALWYLIFTPYTLVILTTASIFMSIAFIIILPLTYVDKIRQVLFPQHPVATDMIGYSLSFVLLLTFFLRRAV